MHQGWKVGLDLYVVLKKKSTRGRLISKNGTKWLFRPNGWKKTVSICPVRFRWHYDNHLQQWPQKLPVILVKSTLQPFKLKKERIGKWTGAATARTCTSKLPVWQVPDTNKIIVGHLGLYRLATVQDGKLVACTEPTTKNIFVGRGPLEPKRFRCLKTACQNKAPRQTSKKIKALYSVPTRDELSVGF